MNELNLILALVLKPLVLVLDDVLLIPLWRLRAQSGFRILLIATIIFLVGELACGVDVYVMRRMTLVGEGLHDVCMLLSTAGFIAGLHRVFSSDHGCLPNGCKRAGSCELDPLRCPRALSIGPLGFALLAGAVAVSALPMFATPIVHKEYLVAGIGDRVMGGYYYDRTEALWVLQQLVFPGVAIASFTVALVGAVARRRLDDLSRWAIYLGLGALSFAWLRTVLVNAYHPNVLATAVIEEVLELMGMLLLGLWVFPRSRKA